MAHAQSGCATTSCVYLPTMLQVAAPSNKVIVINSNTFAPFAGSGPLYMDGEVRNNTKSNVDFVKINAVLRDATGQIVDGDFTYSHANTLTPGMTSGFRLRFSNPPAWATYQFTVTWDTTTQVPYSVSVLNPEAYFDSSK